MRDYVHVADCGEALATLLGCSVQGAVNVGTGQGAAVADVARTVARLVGREDLLQVGAVPGDDRTQVVADTRRLREEVGFTPRWSLEAGCGTRSTGGVSACGGGSRPARRSAAASR